MDSKTYPQGRGGLKAKYVAGVLTFFNGDDGATVYTVNPSSKAIAFSGAVSVTGAVTSASVDSGAGGVKFPASNPGVAGYWWDNAGVLTKSAG